MKLHHYESDQIMVTYDARRCVHAAECVLGLPDVFDPHKRPWVSPSEASAEDVARVVERCPTGALRYRFTDGRPGEAFPEDNRITVSENGPLYVRGRVLVRNEAGTALLQDTRIALCRCGASANKPFCDGSHSDAGFEAP